MIFHNKSGYESFSDVFGGSYEVLCVFLLFFFSKEVLCLLCPTNRRPITQKNNSNPIKALKKPINIWREKKNQKKTKTKPNLEVEGEGRGVRSDTSQRTHTTNKNKETERERERDLVKRQMDAKIKTLS
jgi:hypothetical protein